MFVTELSATNTGNHFRVIVKHDADMTNLKGRSMFEDLIPEVCWVFDRDDLTTPKDRSLRPNFTDSVFLSKFKN